MKGVSHPSIVFRRGIGNRWERIVRGLDDAKKSIYANYYINRCVRPSKEWSVYDSECVEPHREKCIAGCSDSTKGRKHSLSSLQRFAGEWLKRMGEVEEGLMGFTSTAVIDFVNRNSL